MIWKDALKRANVNIHVIATGAGAGLQKLLWEVPGSSAYLSGCSFPYAPEEQEELLGFMPEHFCSEEAAVDLASAAYMKAYKFGGPHPVGVGLTASVASEKEHRGDHRIFVCVMTDDKVKVFHHTFDKGIGEAKRHADGESCDNMALTLLMETTEALDTAKVLNSSDGTELAMKRFMARPFFSFNGKRLDKLPEGKHQALMSGAFNPPHEGHFGMAKSALDKYNRRVVFEITAEPPHKDALTVQDMLQRAKNLQGYDRIFTRKLPLYLDKAKAFPGMPIVMGADAMVRLFDPKWGKSVPELIEEFADTNTTFYVAERLIDGAPVYYENIIELISTQLNDDQLDLAYEMIRELPGRWNISSTELRKKMV